MRGFLLCALLPLPLLTSPAAGQWPPAPPTLPWADTSKDNDPAYRSLFVSLSWKDQVLMLNLRVPRSGAGECHLSGVGAALAPDPVSQGRIAAPLPTPSPRGRTVIEMQPAELYDVAPIFLGNLSMKDGTIHPESKFLTGMQHGIIIVDPQGIFAIPRSQLSRASLKLIKDRAPAAG